MKTSPKQTLNALKSALACRSFKGHDFIEVRTSPRQLAWAKRYTARANRRASNAMAAEG